MFRRSSTWFIYARYTSIPQDGVVGGVVMDPKEMAAAIRAELQGIACVQCGSTSKIPCSRLRGDGVTMTFLVRCVRCQAISSMRLIGSKMQTKAASHG